MKNQTTALFLLFLVLTCSCSRVEKNAFWNAGNEFFEIQQIFDDERFPNVVITNSGTVIVTWGSSHFRVRRSENGGETWGPFAYSSMAVGRTGTPSEGLIYLFTKTARVLK